MKNFIFIIPKTPSNLQDQTRKNLWDLCITSLINQTFKNWTALVIGEETNLKNNDDRFISIDFEGRKEEKLQKATEFILSKNLIGDYIIRLDDDDIINPKILEQVEKLDFDLFVDKNQCFWHYESGKISSRIWFWFPNTCIHKRDHALSVWGDYADGTFQRFKKNALLIENNHSKIHPFYKNKKIILANKSNPIYLRTITSSSITAQSSRNQEEYLKMFGSWKENNLTNFQFLNKCSKRDLKKVPRNSFKERLLNFYLNLKYKKEYWREISK